MSIKPAHVVCLLLICLPLAFLWYSTSSHPGTTIKLWNGNKTPSRQAYEREVLEAVLAVTVKGYGDIPLQIDNTDLPDPADEAAIFRTGGFDIFGTVAGNPKLAAEEKTIIPRPLMKGLLGYRVLIVRAAERDKFATMTSAAELQQLRLGIPLGWADAELFRHNGFEVVEAGSFDDLFARQLAQAFDYTAFGANEVEEVFAQKAVPVGGLLQDESMVIYYPFPLVFYVNPNNPELALRIDQGLQVIARTGELDRIFERHFGSLVEGLNLRKRRLIRLDNPFLPAELNGFESTLLAD